MKTSDCISKGATQLGATLKSLAAVALKARKPAPREKEAPQRPLLILGNGPSLNQTLQTQREAMENYDLLAVNFAAKTPLFTELKPAHYVLADPHFFEGGDDPNVQQMWQALEAAEWPLTLHLPVSMAKHTRAVKWAEKGSMWRLRPFNMIAAEGFPSVSRILFDRGLAMPRPRNVLIPSIMAGIRLGYRRIVIVGADHTWTRTLSVDEQNRVISIQPHFYKDNNAEHERVASVYEGLRLHDVLGSMTIAFRSYHHIADYAAHIGVEILNASVETFIDAFPRLKTL